jgi:quercetin dioxygenase-like cupin family protein
VKVLSLGAERVRPDRPATAIAHDEENARVVAFHLLPGQTIPPHHSRSTVIVTVIAGEGTFRGGEGAALLKAGEMAVYAPGEEHSIEACDGPLHFVALIAPRP